LKINYLAIFFVEKCLTCEKIRIMKKTSLEAIHAIEQSVSEGKSYSEIAEALSLSHRVVRKWGQIIKKGVPSVRQWVVPLQVF
jgi:DNA invertase Pin-like site-specific DNA recombinase